MVIPKPWCGKTPFPCAKAIGLTDAIISTIGAILVGLLPLLIIDIREEVELMQNQNLYSVKQSYIAPENVYYILNVTITSRTACMDYAESFKKFLNEYMKDKVEFSDPKILRNLNIVELPPNGEPSKKRTLILCEIHIRTPKHPDKGVMIYKNRNYTVKSVVLLCIEKHNEHTGITYKDDEVARVILPFPDKVEIQVVYLRPVGLVPERITCINDHMKKTSMAEVERLNQDMMYLLGFSTGASIVSSGLILVSTVALSRTILFGALFFEVLATSLLVGAIIIVNLPPLCMYEYGGMSFVSQGELQEYLVTIITCTSVIYMGVFKLYEIWFIVAYMEAVPALRKAKLEKLKNKMSKEEGKYLSTLADQVTRMNKGEFDEGAVNGDTGQNEKKDETIQEPGAENDETSNENLLKSRQNAAKSTTRKS